MLAALLQPPIAERIPPVSHETDGAPAPPRGGAVRRYSALAVATACGAGYAPVASGTFGSAAGVALYAGLVAAGAGPLGVGLAALLATGLGIWASGEAERIYRRHDDGRIVIDEVAGQLLALWPLAALAAPGARLAPLPLLAAFLVFRALDIAKPGPVDRAQRLPGGFGVMMDDVLAGVLTGALLGAALAAGIFA